MRRFRFKLEKLLALRRYREKEWEIKLAEITGICINLERAIAYAESEKTRVLFKLTAGVGKVDMEILKFRESYTARLSRRVSELVEELSRRRMEQDEIRKKYIEVSRERKVLLKLKERRETEYYKMKRLDEIKEIDDISSSKAKINI